MVSGVVAVATLALGGMQLVLGVRSPVYGALELPPAAVLDSNLRFFGGMAVALALVMLWALPEVERRAGVVWIFWGAALLGGLGRLASLAVVGPPSAPLVAFTLVEVVGAPLALVWYGRSVREPASF